jgi:hypothetical protein
MVGLPRASMFGVNNALRGRLLQDVPRFRHGSEEVE